MKLIDSMLNFLSNKSVIAAEKGTTGDWNWIKYADGTCEMWGNVVPENTQVLVDELATGLYRGNVVVIYPIHLISGIGFANAANSNYFSTYTLLTPESDSLTITITGAKEGVPIIRNIACLIKGRWK